MVEGERKPEINFEKCQFGSCWQWGPIRAVLDNGTKLEVCGEHFLQLIDDGSLDHTELPHFPHQHFTKEFRERYQKTIEEWLREDDSQGVSCHERA